MILLWLPVGMLLPVLSGWFLLRLVEGNSPVLLRLERWALAFLLGLTLNMYIIFLAHWSGLIALNRLGFVSVECVVFAFLGLLFLLQWLFLSNPTPNLNLNLIVAPPSRPSSFVLKTLLILALLWTLAKLTMGGFILVSTPPFYDDTVKNWNLRAKVFYLTEKIPLNLNALEPQSVDPLSSYPPTVSLAKTSLAVWAGTWDEHLINSIHLLWFLALIALVYAAVRRRLSVLWGLWSVVLFVSLPLVLFHGVNAYADIFLAGHLFTTVHLLFLATSEEDAGRRGAYVRLFALAAALLTFTKNEALVLHLPLILALFAGFLFIRVRQRRMRFSESGKAAGWLVMFLLAFLLPWLIYKWGNNLTFGNAKSIGGVYAGWQPFVLETLWTNTFFEGNWHLLYPLLLALALFHRKRILRSPLLILAGFIFVSLALQTGLFLFTSLSAEALMQTGFARGLVQLSPLVVLLVMLLLHESLADFSEESVSERSAQ